jgi:hypothetical protein
MKKLLCFASLLVGSHVWAFCGFYVGKADSSLFNHASQVVVVRDGDKNALTMYADYRGDMKDFALVVPVPSVITREQVNVGDRALIDKLDAYSAPRLVEYFDPDPCRPPMQIRMKDGRGAAPMAASAAPAAKSLGVTIEAQYSVGEYDILILSAKESKGLATWLRETGYKLPAKADAALEPYLKQGLKFFVAKVNLREQAKTGFTYLRPIQFAFESPKFMLPLRLGMINAEAAQDMIVYAITKKGRVETTNYRTVKLPTAQEIPLYVKDKFPDFYKSMFQRALDKEGRKVVFLEYAWNMSWCDPCAADPLKPEELKKLGVFWLDDGNVSNNPSLGWQGGIRPLPGSNNTFITRLHVRYDAEHFPEDLFFQETADTENFQGRYVLRHPWEGKMECAQAETYKKTLEARHTQEAETLASLTGWPMADILKQVGTKPSVTNPTSTPDNKWYKNIFK